MNRSGPAPARDRLRQLPPRPEHARRLPFQPQERVSHVRDLVSEPERSTQTTLDNLGFVHRRRDGGHRVFGTHERVNLLVRVPYQDLAALLLG